MQKNGVFVSYSGRRGEKIAEALQKVSADTFFVAHRSIEVGDEWEKTIWKNLRAASLFVFVVTGDYNQSHYAQQELGAAMALRKNIIPLLGGGAIPEDMPGFAKKYQAMALFSDKPPEKQVKAVLSNIAKQQKEEERRKREAREKRAARAKIKARAPKRQQKDRHLEPPKAKNNKDTPAVASGLVALLALLSSRS